MKKISPLPFDIKIGTRKISLTDLSPTFKDMLPFFPGDNIRVYGGLCKVISVVDGYLTYIMKGEDNIE